jgi:hypothetical protein
LTVTAPNPCSWSEREKVTLNGLNPPAWLLTVPAVNEGLNRCPPHPEVTWNELLGSTGVSLLHGVNLDVVV